LSITFRPIMPFNIKHDMDALLAPNVIWWCILWHDTIVRMDVNENKEVNLRT
jgi:hypothetical protein